MIWLLRFLLPLLALLGALAFGAAEVMNRMSRGWFDRDVRLRAELAVNGARDSLSAAWGAGDAAAMERYLASLARDRRIMSAVACTPSGAQFARAGEPSVAISCETVVQTLGDREHRHEDRTVGGSRVHVSAFRLNATDDAAIVVLAHDMRFADLREAATHRLTLITFLILAGLASAATAVMTRISWRRWNRLLRQWFAGDRPRRRELEPIAADLDELVGRLVEETRGSTAGAWTPERLRTTLKRHLHGERVVILANREPYIHERTAGGGIKVVHPASGLVTALEPVMRACSGVWVAHGSGSADRETVDRRDRIAVPPGEGAYLLRRVWLSKEEEDGYYYGFSNEGLWPLCHVAHTRPEFRASDWAAYRRVNRRFADAVCAEVDRDDPIVLVQDYHFALAPRMIRERLPRATILTFWHIPWPSAERFGICPWHAELLDGLLGSSILGFHTQLHCNNFIDAVDRYLEARIDREERAVVLGGRTSLVRPYPISIDWPSRWAEEASPVAECRARVLADHGLPADTLIGVGIDRLDYTKGIEERLEAVERLLDRFPQFRGRFVFFQLAAPSRTAIPRYRELNERVETIAARVNERHGRGAYRPIVLLREHHEPPTVFRFYRAADLCYVSSLDDGMNLVAKEFVAARDDERGVLVLSQFTGAARELTEALIVNPYDLEQASDAMATALAMSEEEQKTRMHAMRRLVAELNVYRWAGRMLIDSARLRERERLTSNLSRGFGRVEGGVA